MLLPPSVHRLASFYSPIDDEAVAYTGTASQGLTPAKIALCEALVIRFTGGDGKLRFSGQAASTTEGMDVFAGDTVGLSRLEAEKLSGIRSGATNLTGWVTYYR